MRLEGVDPALGADAPAGKERVLPDVRASVDDRHTGPEPALHERDRLRLPPAVAGDEAADEVARVDLDRQAVAESHDAAVPLQFAGHPYRSVSRAPSIRAASSRPCVAAYQLTVMRSPSANHQGPLFREASYVVGA